MQYLPLFARLTNRPCLVVGGGAVAERKVELLLAAGARVTVNAPHLTPGLETGVAAGRIGVHRGPFDPTLVRTHLLVIGATSDPAVNQAVAAAADAALVLCNVVDNPQLSTYISPSLVDRSPLILAVSSGGAAPVLARLVRQQLELWLPLGLGTLATWAGEWRDRVKTRLPGVDRRRRLWEEVFQGALDLRPGIARDGMAGRQAAADQAMEAALTAHTPSPNAPEPAKPLGEAWLVGAGPGDPELLTLRGLYLLQRAEVVLYDRLVAPALLAYARRDAELINVGKTGGGISTSQAGINALLIARVQAGQRVCRLKGGDPYIFGRGSEEALALAAAGLPFQVVPGITAASGCGAYAGIPLTHRHTALAVTFVTGQAGAEPGPDWARLAALGQTLVVYMSGRNLAEVSGALMAHGLAPATPAALVMDGTTDRQRRVIGTLGTLNAQVRAEGLSSPAILYVGDVVALSEPLNWFRPDPSQPTMNPAKGTPP